MCLVAALSKLLRVGRHFEVQHCSAVFGPEASRHKVPCFVHVDVVGFDPGRVKLHDELLNLIQLCINKSSVIIKTLDLPLMQLRLVTWRVAHKRSNALCSQPWLKTD